MRGLIVVSTAALIAVSAPAAAQSGASVDTATSSYLCEFAGKCEGAAEPAAAEPVKAAPATKGFRLGQSGTPTQPAPATKGFRLGSGQTADAPATKGFRLGSGVATSRASRAGRPSASTRRVRPSYASRAGYAAARPAPVAGARADLMLAFELNSDRMTRSAETKARGFAQALMLPELSSKRFMIEGHTDATGNRAANIDLSRRRAQAVADFLVSQGIDRTRVEVKGVGPDEPLPGRARDADINRRVEAVLLG